MRVRLTEVVYNVQLNVYSRSSVAFCCVRFYIQTSQKSKDTDGSWLHVSDISHGIFLFLFFLVTILHYTCKYDLPCKVSIHRNREKKRSWNENEAKSSAVLTCILFLFSFSLFSRKVLPGTTSERVCVVSR